MSTPRKKQQALDVGPLNDRDWLEYWQWYLDRTPSRERTWIPYEAYRRLVKHPKRNRNAPLRTYYEHIDLPDIDWDTYMYNYDRYYSPTSLRSLRKN